MNYKVKSVRFYQAVIINGTMQSYCNAPEYADTRRDGKDNSTLTLHDKGVLIENDSELTLVGWPNIASLMFDKNAPIGEVTEQSSKSAGKKKVDFRDI